MGKGKGLKFFIAWLILLPLTWSVMRKIGITDLSPIAICRWLGISVLCYYLIWKQKGLTTWILFSMVIGAEFGHDFPAIASELKVVSKIFLKLIKTIIAPLIFGTLVVGIAGHANLKQVGRMGWKSILYFEVATTIALFIGLVAINISKAGVGIQLPPTKEKETL